MQYTILTDGSSRVLTVLHGGSAYVATSETHPNFNDLVQKALADDASVVNDFTVEKAVQERFEALSERVSVAGGQVYFDGDVVNDALTEQILRFVESGVEDWYPLVAFFEKVAQNPNEHSREQLFRWLAKHNFTLTEEGDIVGYKSVQADFGSIHTGPAIVDSKPVNGHVPNLPGSTIEMARSSVQFDPSVSCASGLHVANWDYATTWTTYGHIMEIHVNPRDVVSVPTDSGDSKVRVCRYYVAGEVTEPYDGPVLEAANVEPEEPKSDCPVCHDDCGWCPTSNVNDEDDSDYDEDDSPCAECDDYYCDGDCDEEEESDSPSYNVYLGGIVSGGYGSGKTDTRLNYQNQQRGPGGRFLPKS